MNIQRIKKAAAGAALALTLTLGGGMILGTAAQAQDRGYNNRWQDQDDRRDRDWRDRDGRNDRDWRNNRDFDRNGYRDRDNVEMRRGFQDGFNRGVNDARYGRYFNPNSFMRFRFSSALYRAGFNRGYTQGFHQFDRYRRW